MKIRYLTAGQNPVLPCGTAPMFYLRPLWATLKNDTRELNYDYMIIDIIFFLIVFGLFGGLIYLIYWPFKRRLLKTGRLTKRLNRHINWIYVISLSMICFVLFCFRNYRTSSKVRLENISDVKLPHNYKVIKDEYQDMWQDYCIIYDIQFDNSTTKELIQSIKKSKFYNPNKTHNDLLQESDFITVGSDKAVWIKSGKGYEFSKPYDRTTYSITLDTSTYKLSYNECAD